MLPLETALAQLNFTHTIPFKSLGVSFFFPKKNVSFYLAGTHQKGQ